MSRFPFTSSAHDHELLSHVRPPDWVNPEPASKYHLVVIGAGAAGLVTAAGAAGLGARVALVERHLMGGDCLNAGCVPSKALLASARAVAAAKSAGALGIAMPEIVPDFAAVMERMRRMRAAIAHHDGAHRFSDLGVDVFFGEAKFRSPHLISVDGRGLRFSRAVLATGGRARVPEVPGLDAAGFRTNETIFDLTVLPPRLAVIGGGPIGCELAQAFARLGSRVTIVQIHPRVLPREDPDASELLLGALRAEGLDVRLEARLQEVETVGSEKVLHLDRRGARERLGVDEILVAVGRRPNVEGLGLELAGVEIGPDGVVIDDQLRTTHRRVFAVGDVALPQRFTHAADAAARIVIQNALLPLKRKLSSLVIPWCTYTDPEIAHVGDSEQSARGRGLAVETVTVPFGEVDRARLEGDAVGFVRVHAEAKTGRICGATIVGHHAGELISEISTAMRGGLSLGELSSVVHPYPTRAESIRKAGDAWNRRRLTPHARNGLPATCPCASGGLPDSTAAKSTEPADARPRCCSKATSNRELGDSPRLRSSRPTCRPPGTITQNTNTLAASSIRRASSSIELRRTPSVSSPSVSPRASMQLPQASTSPWRSTARSMRSRL